MDSPGVGPEDTLVVGAEDILVVGAGGSPVVEAVDRELGDRPEGQGQVGQDRKLEGVSQ